MKKFFALIFLFLFIFLSITPASEASDRVNAYLFYGKGCPHCAKEIEYLNSIKDKYPELNVLSFEVYYERDNSILMQKVAEELGAEAGGVPFFVIGDKYFIGFSEAISPIEIEDRIKYCINNSCLDVVNKIINPETIISPKDNLEEVVAYDDGSINNDILNGTVNEKKQEKLIKLPFLGEVDIHKFSLPVITLILAFLDGFNPCAMWVLLFLVSLLFGIENKKRLWIFGLIFLTASALVYFLFMTAWLNLFMFLGLIAVVRIIIGIVALISGYYNLKEYITNPGGGCKVTGGEKRHKIFERLSLIIKEKNLFIAIPGLILLAFAVNLVELVCSLGLPAVYTQILSLSNLNTLHYYLYLVFYVIVFILPAFIVFAISAITLQLTGISGKYGRIVHLISGIVMLVLGVLMIFKPELLMFA